MACQKRPGSSAVCAPVVRIVWQARPEDIARRCTKGHGVSGTIFRTLARQGPCCQVVRNLAPGHARYFAAALTSEDKQSDDRTLTGTASAK
jgi:hypothetical protein